MTDLVNLKFKVLPTFPSNIIGGTGIDATKQNGHVTIDMDWSEFGTQSFIPTSPTNNVLTFDTATNSYIMVPSHLLGGATAGIADAPVDGVQYGRQSAGWTPISGGSSFVQAGSGAVNRTMQNKARDIFSVKDFGAIGDGIANDYPAIVAADAAAAASGYRQIYFPAGSYNIAGNTYTPSQAMRIVGDNRATTIIRTSSATANILNLANGFETVENLQFNSSVTRTGGYYINITTGACTLRNLMLMVPFKGINLGSAASTVLLDTIGINNPVATTGMGIEVSGGLLIQLRNVEVLGSGHFTGMAVHNCGDITLVDCNFIGAVYNFLADPSSGQSVLSVLSVGTWYDQATSYNVVLAPTGTGAVNRCSWEGGWACGGATVSTAGFAMLASGSASINGITITGMDIFGSSYGVTADGAGISNLIISNNKIAGNGGSGINLNNIGSAVITGNRIGSTGGYGVNGVGLAITGTSDNFLVANNDLRNNTTIANVPAPSATKIFRDNPGYLTDRTFTISGTTDGTGQITGTHGLAGAPNQVLLSTFGAGAFIHAQLTGVSSTTITVKAYNDAAVAIASTSVNIYALVRM